MDQYVPPLDVHVYMAVVLAPILFANWVRSLKYLVPFSFISNAVMYTGAVGRVQIGPPQAPAGHRHVALSRTVLCESESPAAAESRMTNKGLAAPGSHSLLLQLSIRWSGAECEMLRDPQHGRNTEHIIHSTRKREVQRRALPF